MKNFGICYSSSKSDRHPLSTGDAATHDTEIGDGGMQPHAGVESTRGHRPSAQGLVSASCRQP